MLEFRWNLPAQVVVVVACRKNRRAVALSMLLEIHVCPGRYCIVVGMEWNLLREICSANHMMSAALRRYSTTVRATRAGFGAPTRTMAKVAADLVAWKYSAKHNRLYRPGLRRRREEVEQQLEAWQDKNSETSAVRWRR